MTRRVLLTSEYAPSAQEQKLYDQLYAYISQPVKLAFPEMDPYDLALRLLGMQGSSTAAIVQTIRGVIKRLERTPGAQAEFLQLFHFCGTNTKPCCTTAARITL